MLISPDWSRSFPKRATENVTLKYFKHLSKKMQTYTSATRSRLPYCTPPPVYKVTFWQIVHAVLRGRVQKRKVLVLNFFTFSFWKG